MIHRLRIRDWRAYRSATIDFSGRLVFFVAPNGVGKSALYEAARHALLGFPSGRGIARGIRGDADSAELSMDLTLANRRIAVTRTITRNGRTTFAATSDGANLDEAAFRELVRTSWSADAALVDRLVFGDLDPTGRTKATLPIREHLAELMGVTPMLDAAAELRDAGKAARKSITGLREDVSGSQTAILEAETAHRAAERAFEEVATTLADLSARLEAAQERSTAATAWTEYRAAVEAYNADVATLVTEIGQQISIDPADPAGGLDGVRKVIEADLRAAREARAAAQIAAARSTAAADALAAPVEQCPTCLRPLTEDERLTALHTHTSTSAEAEGHSHQAEANLEEREQRLGIIADFSRRLEKLTRPTAPIHDDPSSEAHALLAELRAQDRALTERLGEARAHRDTTHASLQRERGNLDNADRLNRAAREELLLDTTADMFEQVADRYLSERIEPLAQDIAHRWKLLLGQEGLILGPTGEIRLRRGSVDLELDDMSGGERAIAGIVVRLLVTSAVTRIPTIWFDEPLEHLDPRRRAGIAQTLVSAAATNTIDQIVVTTYEEPVVRRLALAAPELVTIVYAETEPAIYAE